MRYLVSILTLASCSVLPTARIFKDIPCKEYIIIDVTPNKILIQMDCGSDKHWADNYYHYNDTVIGMSLTELPEYSFYKY